MALTVASNPQTGETQVLVDGAWTSAEQVAVNPKDQSKAYLVGGKWLTDTGTADLPKPRSSLERGYDKALLDPKKAELETAATLVTGAVGSVAGGLAGIGQGIKNTIAQGAKDITAPYPSPLWDVGMPAAERVEKVSRAMTYEPRSAAGKTVASGVQEGLSYLTEKPGELVGGGVQAGATALGASPEVAGALGAGAKTATEVVPQALLGRGAGVAVRGAGAVVRGVEAAGVTEEAGVAAARAYVGKIGIDWDRLPAAFKDKLTQIAGSAKGLEGLKPEQVARQARLAEVGIENPTRGQVTRDPVQQRAEQLTKGTGAGKELREQDLNHNAKLLEGVENLRAKVAGEKVTGPRARGDLPVGKSVQDNALRRKAAAKEQVVNKAYDRANREEGSMTADVTPLVHYLEDHVDPLSVSWVKARLKVKGAIRDIENEETGESRMVAGAEMRLDELERIRREAIKKHKAGGDTAADAHEVRMVIDDIMKDEGGKYYKEARGLAREYLSEFEDQGGVSKLVGNKPGTSDRRVAVEETARTSVLGPLEDLQKVKRSLLTGKDSESRQAGRTAWRDLKGWGVDYLMEKATKGPKNERGQPNLGWGGFKQGLDDIGDANLDELYGPSVRKQLRRYADALEDLKTEAPTGVKGSPTVDKILTYLDRLGSVTKYVGGGVVTDLAGAGIRKGAEVVRGAAEVRRAKATPIDEAITEKQVSDRRARNARAARVGAPLVPAGLEQRTYGDDR